jgi:hypothetical protein
MEESASQDSPANRNAFVPLALLMGLGSVVSSFAISNYLGMALALITFLLTHFALKNVSRSVWIGCVTLATSGFALGLTALFMRILVDTIRR